MVHQGRVIWVSARGLWVWAWSGQAEFGQRASLPMSWTSFQGIDVVIAVVANSEGALAVVTGVLLDGKDAMDEDGVSRPRKAHRSPSRTQWIGAWLSYAHRGPAT